MFHARGLLTLLALTCAAEYGRTIAFTHAAINAGSKRGGVVSKLPVDGAAARPFRGGATRTFTQSSSTSRRLVATGEGSSNESATKSESVMGVPDQVRLHRCDATRTTFRVVQFDAAYLPFSQLENFVFPFILGFFRTGVR